MVSINDVYQKVLALANKEQRGYITPQEFNLFADQAQQEIFEQYFYDLNQSMRLPGNNAGHSDIVTNIEEKISLFERYDRKVSNVSDSEYNLLGITNSGAPSLYRLSMVRVDYGQGKVDAEEIQINELNKYIGSKLGVPTKKRPVYSRFTEINSNPTSPAPGKKQTIKIYPEMVSSNDLYISYIEKPIKPEWGYEIVGEKALYNSDNSNNFELHESEESELVYRILALAGLAIQKPELTQIAAALEGAKVQQEKQ